MDDADDKAAGVTANLAIPAKISDKYAKNGEDMMEILTNDIFRYEALAEQAEMDALASALSGNNDQQYEFEEVSLEVLNDDGVEDKENKENDRFKTVTLEETDKFLEDNVNKNTSYKTKSDMKIFSDWLRVNNELREVKDIPALELDSLLARFYLGVRKRDGTEYEPDTITSIKNSIDRYLKNNKVNIDIKSDDRFSHSRRVLEAKRKHLKGEGKGSKKNKAESLDEEETGLLYQKQILGSGNPQSLLNTVWMNNGVYFGFRGRQDHTNLLLGDLELKKDSKGTEYIEFTERSTKTRSGAKHGDHRAVAPKMFAKPNSTYCPVKMYKEYIDHRPEDLRQDPKSRFYLRPLVNPKTDVWYSHLPVGKNKMGEMMKTMATDAKLSGRKVNHSTRKTFATTLLHSDRANTEVAQLGGWKSIQSLNEYSVPSCNQQKQASDILSSIMLPKENIETKPGNDNVDENTPLHVNDDVEQNTGDLVVTPLMSSDTCTGEVGPLIPVESKPIVAIPDLPVQSTCTLPLESNCTSTAMMSLASSHSRKDSNPFSVFCGANISGGVINLNIYSGKRKHFLVDSESSQE